MEKWEGLVAVVTGASSGIGRAISIKLAEHGMKVAALARRKDRLKELEERFQGKGKGEIRGYVCDVTNEENLDQVFERVETEIGIIRVLVNNAGIAPYINITDFDIDHWRKTFDVNVFAMFSCIKRLVASVRKHNPGLVHIINMNSVAGHSVIEDTRALILSVSKHCVTLFTRGLIKQLDAENLNIKVTSLSPGLVNTEVLEVGGWDREALKDWPSLEPQDIANAAVTALQTQEDIQISELTVTGRKGN